MKEDDVVKDVFEQNWSISPQGDQPQAIEKIVERLSQGIGEQILLGVTGSGKTFTIANVIARTQRPALVIAPNKTLAAQLFQEFKFLFPNNAVEYFISYYDFYQPEAYVPSTDTFIAKSSAINEDIDKMRHSATRALFERRDVIIVSSVSCIYGLGDPKAYYKALIVVEKGQKLARDDFIRQLIAIQYTRNDISLERGKFRVRGDSVEVVPAHELDRALRIQFWGNEVERVCVIDALKGNVLQQLPRCVIYPKTHHLLDGEKLDQIIENITTDLRDELTNFKESHMLLEAQRLEQRTLHDLEMIREIGYCQGIENYSRYLDGRKKAEPPATLLDYFPNDYLLFIDESHVTIPQIGGMYRGDRARKETLVKHGFRLQAALDNRPLNFEEFRSRMAQTVYVSATPGAFEQEKCGTEVVEQIIRPTGLVDPQIALKPARLQIDDLLLEIQKTVARKGRVLVTVLTKKIAEDVTSYLSDLKIKARYLHSEIHSIERVQILRDLRLGVFDVLIGINLLREGLDLPEVELVAILDADKEGFLRSHRSLIQTIGRAARNAQGRVILYADKITESIQKCLEETERRRDIQLSYNAQHGIVPQTILKHIPEDLRKLYNLDFGDEFNEKLLSIVEKVGDDSLLSDPRKIEKTIEKFEKEMKKSAVRMDFEEAADLRDKIQLLKDQLILLSTEQQL